MTTFTKEVGGFNSSKPDTLRLVSTDTGPFLTNTLRFSSGKSKILTTVCRSCSFNWFSHCGLFRCSGQSLRLLEEVFNLQVTRKGKKKHLCLLDRLHAHFSRKLQVGWHVAMCINKRHFSYLVRRLGLEAFNSVGHKVQTGRGFL